MTRINLDHPSALTNRHLIAEIREIKHVPKALIRSLNAKTGFAKSRIPKHFTLNTGHVTFFYDKGLFIHKRFKLLIEEALRRNINLNTEHDIDPFPVGFNNDYVPDDIAINVSRERIKTRILEKPHLYPDKDIFFNYIMER